MPLVLALLLYSAGACALVTGAGLGLMALADPFDRGILNIAQIAAVPVAVAPVDIARVASADAAPGADSPDRVPAWIAPTPKYDLPTPQVARRDVENAKKMAGDRARKARISRQKRKPWQVPDMNADARAAYGYAPGSAPQRLFFGTNIP